ncbi:MAG: type IV secretion system protein [bacterium]|nr:type IV secretion system protein [bacterium]
MKKFLPLFFFILIFCSLFFLIHLKANAQAINIQGTWQQDPEVTFIGKMAARSNDFIDWILTKGGYKWVPEGIDNPLASFWVFLRNIVYAFLALFVLITAFLMIIRRGEDVSIGKLIPKFLLIIFLITFSFAFVSFLYQVTDIIQGFFLKPPGRDTISSKDLLAVGFKYQDFIGLIRTDSFSEESAFISLLLTKITALTYFIMGGILVVRKVILWFFIIASPLFPILLFYYPIKNTAKIWIGEFFRWLLYAPLFALLLQGLVVVWRSNFLANFKFIDFDQSRTYQTAVNILIGGPGQTVSYENSVNNPNTFGQYLLALLMLWVVMLLPFVLLKIFLDYMQSISLSENSMVKQIVNVTSALLNKNPTVSQNPVGPYPTPPTSTGVAMKIPFMNKVASSAQKIPSYEKKPAGLAREIPITFSQPVSETKSTSVFNRQTIPVSANILNLANLSLPKMTDIARYEAATMSNDIRQHEEIARVHETLEKIANPSIIAIPSEREHFTQVRESLIKEKEKGNITASNVLTAANTIANTQINNMTQSSITSASSLSTYQTNQISKVLQNIDNSQSVTDSSLRNEYSQIKEKVLQENAAGNPLATELLSDIKNSSQEKLTVQKAYEVKEKLQQAKDKGDPLASKVLSVLQKEEEKATISQVLNNISNPQAITEITSQQSYRDIKETLLTESKKGNELASIVLSATTSSEKVSEETKERIKEKIKEGKDKNDPVATALSSAIEKEKTKETAKTAVKTSEFPAVNKVQSISLDDYEEVRKMWQENYQKLEPPKTIGGKQATREEWIKKDMDNINQTINLLLSPDKQKVNKGMAMVGKILPFLLIGGFSQTEVVAYLKAKMEAGKTTLSEIESKEEEEETKVGVERKENAIPKEMSAQAEAQIDKNLKDPLEEKEEKDNNNNIGNNS